MSAKYRKIVAKSLLYKFFVYVCGKERISTPSQTASSADFLTENSAASGLHLVADQQFEFRQFAQGFRTNTCSGNPTNVIGAPVSHTSIVDFVTGRAQFVDDLLPQGVELFCAWARAYGSPHADIVGMDTTHACNFPGVVRVLTCNDVPGTNSFGVIKQDEEVLASSKVFAACIPSSCKTYFPLSFLIVSLLCTSYSTTPIRYYTIENLLALYHGLQQHGGGSPCKNQMTEFSMVKQRIQYLCTCLRSLLWPVSRMECSSEYLRVFVEFVLCVLVCIYCNF